MLSNKNRVSRPGYFMVTVALASGAWVVGCSDDDGMNDETTPSVSAATAGSGGAGAATGSGGSGATVGSGGAGATGGAGGGQVVPADPDAVWLTPENLTYVEVMPGVVSFASAYGDWMTGAHGTFAKVTAGAGLPSHSHMMSVHAVNIAGPIAIPVPSDQTAPPMLMTTSYGFVPAGAEHAMNCMDSVTDCVFFIEQAGAFNMTMETPAGGATPIAKNPAAVQLPMADLQFGDLMPGVVQVAALFGDFTAGEHGTMVKVTAGMGIPRHWHTMAVDALVLEGEMNVPVPYNQSDVVNLTPGSYYYVPAGAEHMMNCTSGQDCVFYIHQAGAFDLNVVED